MYKLLAGQFDCLSTLSPEELLTVAKALADSYPDNLDNSFVDELCHFAKLADIFKDDEHAGNISTELCLYKLIIGIAFGVFFLMLRFTNVHNNNNKKKKKKKEIRSVELGVCPMQLFHF